jgi:hypothetical protein
MKQLAIFVLALVAVVVPVFAHHSFAAEYDIKSTVTLKGTITNIEWQNPHARFYVDVKGEDGKVVNWEIESGSPNQLARGGWTRSALKVGDVVTVEGYRAKDGANLADAKTITTAEGRKLSAGGGEPR